MQSSLGNYCSMAVADRARVFVCVCVCARIREDVCVCPSLFVFLCFEGFPAGGRTVAKILHREAIGLSSLAQTDKTHTSYPPLGDSALI